LRRVVISSVLAIALLVPALAAAYDGDVRFEAEEHDRLRLDGKGQNNRVVEAIADRGATPGGILLLDDFWDTTGTAHTVDMKAVPGFVLSGADENYQPGITTRGDLERTSGGMLPKAILPGTGMFNAWYGRWEDKNGDGIIDDTYEDRSPFDEWFPIERANLYSYVVPGAHPNLYSSTRPSEDGPDFTYVYRGTPQMYRSASHLAFDRIVFLDGSLFTHYVVDTVVNPLLVPSPGKPFTPQADSLVDIDEYPVVAPGPVAQLYKPFGDAIVAPLGSPSFATCPGSCEYPPFAFPAPLDGPAALVQGRLYAPYEQESRAASDSSAAGRLLEFQTDYLGWVDLIPDYAGPDPLGYLPVHHGPVPGRSADGRPAMIPGHLGFTLRSGLWKDLNEDGWIGAAGPDPHLGGNRPIADAYLDAKGEYIADWLVNAANTRLIGLRYLTVTLTPTPDWGPAGAFVMMNTYTPAVDGQSVLVCGLQNVAPIVFNGAPDPSKAQCAVDYGTASVNDPNARLRRVTGNEPVTLSLHSKTLDPGFYQALQYLYLPQGTLGFSVRACTEEAFVKYNSGGLDVNDRVWDCDTLAPLAVG